MRHVVDDDIEIRMSIQQWDEVVQARWGRQQQQRHSQLLCPSKEWIHQRPSEPIPLGTLSRAQADTVEALLRPLTQMIRCLRVLGVYTAAINLSGYLIAECMA